jgi:hypothetical protein
VNPEIISRYTQTYKNASLAVEKYFPGAGTGHDILEQVHLFLVLYSSTLSERRLIIIVGRFKIGFRRFKTYWLHKRKYSIRTVDLPRRN